MEKEGVFIVAYVRPSLVIGAPRRVLIVRALVFVTGESCVRLLRNEMAMRYGHDTANRGCVGSRKIISFNNASERDWKRARTRLMERFGRNMLRGTGVTYA